MKNMRQVLFESATTAGRKIEQREKERREAEDNRMKAEVESTFERAMQLAIEAANNGKFSVDVPISYELYSGKGAHLLWDKLRAEGLNFQLVSDGYDYTGVTVSWRN